LKRGEPWGKISPGGVVREPGEGEQRDLKNYHKSVLGQLLVGNLRGGPKKSRKKKPPKRKRTQEAIGKKPLTRKIKGVEDWGGGVRERKSTKRKWEGELKGRREVNLLKKGEKVYKKETVKMGVREEEIFGPRGTHPRGGKEKVKP